MAVQEKAIVLLSGGLDSTVSLAWAVREFSVVRAIFVAYGQKALRAEANAAGEIARRYNVEVLHVELPFFAQICRSYETVSAHKCEGSSQLPPDTTDELLSVWVPNRNMVFASIAAAFGESLGCEVVVTGFNAEEGEQFPDNTQEFVTRMNSALELSTLSSVRLVCPLIDLDKVIFGKKVSNRRRIKNLVQINTSIPGTITLIDRMRFFHLYTGKNHLKKEDKEIIRKIIRLSWKRNPHWHPRFGIDSKKIVRWQ